MKEIEVYFVRHGETMYNLMRKMQGWSDTPLTSRGLPILDETGDKLRQTKFDAVYSSDLKRALDTAKIMLDHNEHTDVDIHESKYFREIFFGSFEGLQEEKAWEIIGKPYGLSTIEEFRTEYSPDFLRDATKEADIRHLAENADEVAVRMKKGFNQLLTENEDHSRVLVTTHGGFIKDMVTKNGLSASSPTYGFPKNGSITKTIMSEEGIVITDYND